MEKHLVFDLDNTIPNGAPVFTQSARNEDVPLHEHSYIEFFYVFDGKGVQELNGKEKVLQRGEAYLLTLGDAHKFHKTIDGLFLRRDILISTSFFEETCNFLSPSLFLDISNDKYSKHLVLSSEEISSIESYVPFLFLDPDSREYLFAAKMLVTYLINLMIAYDLRQSSTNIPDWLSSLATRLSTYDNFKVELSELIKDLPFTPDYIRRMFKKHFHMTMTDYFNKQKINYAYFLLKKTDVSIEDICDAIGFLNVSYFFKLFKNTMYTTPNKIRKEAKGK